MACLFAFASQSASAIDDSSQVYLQKGIEEKNAQRYMVASQYFEKATNINDKNVQAYLQNALVNLEMRKTDQAKAAFTKVYELDPTNSIAIQNLAELYFSYRQFQKAIDFAGKTKNYANADRIIGMSHYQLEDYASAVNALAIYLQKNPTDAQATYTMGRSYLDMEEYKKAFPFYAKAVELDKSKNVWAYELGLLSYTLNDYKNAAKYFNVAIENGYPQGNDVSENLGFSYIYSGEFEKGEKLLLSVIAKKPGSKDLLRDIAETYYQNKMYDKSLEFCQKLLEMNMKDGKALWQAGLCFQKKGEKDRGQQMCDKAIELDPSLAGMRQKSMSPMGL